MCVRSAKARCCWPPPACSTAMQHHPLGVYSLPCRAFPKVKVAPGHPRFWQDRNRLTGGGISSGLDEALELIKL